MICFSLLFYYISARSYCTDDQSATDGLWRRIWGQKSSSEFFKVGERMRRQQQQQQPAIAAAVRTLFRRNLRNYFGPNHINGKTLRRAPILLTERGKHGQTAVWNERVRVTLPEPNLLSRRRCRQLIRRRCSIIDSGGPRSGTRNLNWFFKKDSLWFVYERIGLTSFFRSRLLT